MPVLLRFAALALVAQIAMAHHSFVEFDGQKTIEISGTLVEVRWRNPHVGLTVRVFENGREVLWDVEADSVSVLRRSNLSRESLHVGERVTVAGSPSRRSPARMLVTNVLTADGSELVLAPGGKPRWKPTAYGTESAFMGKGGVGDPKLGIFRVWSTRYGEKGMFLFPPRYPLTDKAKALVAKWNPLAGDTVTLGCKPKGVPTIMETPYPMEFVKDRDSLLVRMEEYDTVRRIDMSASAAQSGPPRLLGYSIGRWEDKTLVVMTTGISWRYTTVEGVPLAPGATLTERFTPSDDGGQLKYSLVINDPQTFTQPVELSRLWVWDPRERIEIFNCGKSR
jgi:hypothetical protein